MLANAEIVRSKCRKRKAKVQGQERLRKLYAAIRTEYARKMKFSTWGLHNHIIDIKVKVRMTEDLIECAQRL